MNFQDKNMNKILSVKEKDMIIDLVTNDGDKSSWRKVTRRFRVIAEIKNFYRLILVEVGDEFELRTQSWGGGFVKEGWCDNRTIILHDEQINEMKRTIDGWR